MPFEELHVPPGDTSSVETVLKPGELITAFAVPAPSAPLALSESARSPIL